MQIKLLGTVQVSLSLARESLIYLGLSRYAYIMETCIRDSYLKRRLNCGYQSRSTSSLFTTTKLGSFGKSRSVLYFSQ
jgi:hypothetical protein